MKRTRPLPPASAFRVRPALRDLDSSARREVALTARTSVPEPSSPIRVLIVDDERLGRERLASLLAREADLEIVGQCANGADALKAITSANLTRRPDLVLLDVQMPELDGIEVAEALVEMAPDREPPELLFVTAFSEFMERAFELHAVDYLRKPFTEARFASALTHARRRIADRRLARRAATADAAETLRTPWEATIEQLQELVARVREERPPERIAILNPANGALTLIDASRVAWVQAHGAGEVLLHGRDATRTWNTGIEAAEQKLAPLGFVRVHRHHLIHPDHITEAKPLQKGQYLLTLQGTKTLDTGRTYASTMARILDRVPGAR